jgi:cytochrome c553
MKKLMILAAMAIVSLISTPLLAGDAAAGKTVFMQCVACHGQNGEGMEALKAPKLAGQHAWYTASQLKKFKDGVRGKGDPTAATMIPFAMMLNDKQMADVAAYIATL